jgi:hypothetical protein
MLTIYCVQSDSPQGFDGQAFRQKRKERKKKESFSPPERKEDRRALQ